MYTYAVFVILLIQISNVTTIYSLEIELFKQKINYYIFRSYHYMKSHINKWFVQPEIPKVEKKQIERYEDKYKERFSNLEITQLDQEYLKKLKTNILLENTPIGNIIMFYNSEKEAFEYYSDKIIPYRFLNTVGRKYVIQFRCKSIFVEKVTEKNQKGKIKFIKEANRYICLGKLANFSFLQKIKRNTNKLTFKEYKNMIY